MLAYIVDIIFIFSPFYLVIPGGWGTFVKTCTNMPPDEHLRGIHRQNNMFILQTTILNVYLRCLLESKVQEAPQRRTIHSETHPLCMTHHCEMYYSNLNTISKLTKLLSVICICLHIHNCTNITTDPPFSCEQIVLNVQIRITCYVLVYVLCDTTCYEEICDSD